MRVISESTLQRFREATHCGYCRQRLRLRSEPHHVFTRGLVRLDVSLNLLSLGSAMDCGCHTAFHNGCLPRSDLVAMISQREELLFSEDELRNLVYLFARAPKDATAGWFAGQTLDWTAGERLLVARTLKEVGL